MCTGVKVTIGFGWEFDKDGNGTRATAADVEFAVKALSRKAGVRFYTYSHNSHGAWTNAAGFTTVERGGTVEAFLTGAWADDVQRFKALAALIRDEFQQDCVLFAVVAGADVSFI